VCVVVSCASTPMRDALNERAPPPGPLWLRMNALNGLCCCCGRPVVLTTLEALLLWRADIFMTFNL
jgi:hypothetical protein